MAEQETAQVETTTIPASEIGAGAPDAAAMAAELEQIRKALKEANREAAERRKKLEAYEQAETARKEAEMSEIEKAQKRAHEAEAARDQALQQANDRLIRAAFVAEAAKAGATHPEDAFALADRAAVKIAEDGAVAGVAEAVKALVEGGRLVMSARPQAPPLDGGVGGGDRTTGNPKPLSEDELLIARKLGLTAEQYQRGKKP
jgi:vacuolar-type H+-ATPase subunit I/STV1